jgi:hypothetical protein
MTTTPNPKYALEQRVWVYDINRRRSAGPEEATVVKVGRKLVTVKRIYGEETFRIVDGVRNDSYGHAHILTDEDRNAEDRRSAAVKRLKAAHLGIALGYERSFPLDTLEAIVAVLDGQS